MSVIEIHPVNPQPRLVKQVCEVLKSGGVVALPTDSGYAICTQLGNKEGMVDNKAFRTIKALTPGPYTFILPGTKEIPRMTLNKKKHTVGVRLPDHNITQAVVEELGEPVLCSTLILPGEEEALWDPLEVDEKVGREVDLVVDGPVGNEGVTTVIDFTSGSPEVVRQGAGSVELFD